MAISAVSDENLARLQRKVAQSFACFGIAQSDLLWLHLRQVQAQMHSPVRTGMTRTRDARRIDQADAQAGPLTHACAFLQDGADQPFQPTATLAQPFKDGN